MFDKLAFYWRTLRHLKPVQFYSRVWFRLYRPRVAALLNNVQVRLPSGLLKTFTVRTPSMLGPTAFRFLNRTHLLSSHGGWNNVELEKLWVYNLHYFDDLNAQNAFDRQDWHRALIARWIAENPPANGNGWEPYPTSLRVVNWVKWLAVGNTPLPGMVNSLVLQSGWLNERLEWHLLGNHLFTNAKALVYAGLYFEGRQAAAWLAKGLKIIRDQLPEQVLADGGNFERSPMYHAIFLEDLLDLINASQCWSGQVPNEQVAVWRETAGRMLNWLTGMTHPDGEIALFNDAAFGVAPRLAELTAYARRVGVEFVGDAPLSRMYARGSLLHHFADSGYVCLQNQYAVVFLDVAPIGPDYLPGHAHADTLSFELSVFGQRVVVNGGTSRYGLGPERQRERSTAAHSTVEVAGVNSSEVWGGFRVARRAYPFDLVVQPENAYVACSHNGYIHLPAAPVHRRTWQMQTNSLHIRDTVSGGLHSAVVRYLLHPDLFVDVENANTWNLAMTSGHHLRAEVLTGVGRLEPAKYAPEFGKQLHTQSLVVELTAGLAEVKFTWAL